MRICNHVLKVQKQGLKAIAENIKQQNRTLIILLKLMDAVLKTDIVGQILISTGLLISNLLAMLMIVVMVHVVAKKKIVIHNFILI